MDNAKAAVVTAFNEPLVLREVPIPQLKPGGVPVLGSGQNRRVPDGVAYAEALGYAETVLKALG